MSGKVKATKKNASDDWQTALATTNINSEDWKCQVSIVVESDARDIGYLDKFHKAAKEEARMVIKAITFEETIIMVKQIGSSKDITFDEKVFEVANNYIKQGSTIPENMLALLIKYQILRLKADHVKIKTAKQELSEGLENESMMMMNMNISARDKNSKPVKAVTKHHTALRELGEEWKDKVYIEDYPKDGPELYICILGFRKFNLVQELLTIQVPLVAVIKLETDEEIANVVLHPVSSTIGSVLSVTKKNCPDIEMFWEDLFISKTAPESADVFKNLAFISFTPPYKKTIPEGLTENMIVYDEISFLLYDIQDLTRQHWHYLENMKILNVDADPNEFVSSDKMITYRNIVKTVPLDVTTIPVILYALITQIEELHCVEGVINQIPLNKSWDSCTSLSTAAYEKINDIFENENITDKICEIKISEMGTKNVSPVPIIPWGDFITTDNYFHKTEFKDFTSINLEKLSTLPIPKLWKFFPLNEELESKLKLNMFHECMKEHPIPLENAARLINLMCCKRLCDERFFYDFQLYHKSLRKRQRTLRSDINPITIKPFKSNSFAGGEYPDFNLIDCPIASVVRFASTIGYPEPKEFDDIVDILESHCPQFELELEENSYNINDYKQCENLTFSCMLQALNKAYSEFNTCNIKYCSVTDKLIITFFNKTLNSINEYDWLKYIPVAVCLRDFFDYVFDEEYDWIVTEENKHDSLFGLRNDTSTYSEFKKVSVLKNFETVDFEKEMMLKDSLKYSEQKIHENTFKNSVEYEAEKIYSVASNISNTNKLLEIDDPQDENEFKFLGYNLKDGSVLTTGKSKSFISQDGTSIHFSTYNNFDNNFFTSTRLTTTNYDLYIHSPYNPLTKQIENLDTVRLNFRFGMNMVFQKTFENQNLSRDLLTSPVFQPYHHLKLSWSNGLFLEPVWSPTNTLPLYVKQTLTHSKNSSELYRCFSASGEIIIYKTNGDIQILYPDGSIYLIMESDENITSDATQQFKDSVDEFLKTGNFSMQSLTSETADTLKGAKLQKTLSGSFSHYDVIQADGKVYKIRNGEVVSEDKLIIRTAQDYLTGEIYSRRLDGTNTLLNKDGLQTVSFSDGSKITSYFIVESQFGGLDKQESVQETILNKNTQNIRKLYTISEEQDLVSNFMDDVVVLNLVYIIEHPDYAAITINTSKHVIQLNLPHKIEIEIEANGVYRLNFENLSTAVLSQNILSIKDTKCLPCVTQSNTTINFVFSQDESEILMKTSDCFGKICSLSYFGNLFLSDDLDSTSKICNCNEKDCCKVLQKNQRRFFVLNRDLTGEEFIHKETKNLYSSTLDRAKWTRIETFQDPFNPHLTSEVSLFPYYPSMSYRWNMEPIIINTKPKTMTFSDLKKKKDIYAWMQPYPRKLFLPSENKKDDLTSSPKAMIVRIFKNVVPEEWDIPKNMEAFMEKYICLLKVENKNTNFKSLEEFSSAEEELKRCGQEIYDNLLKSLELNNETYSSRKKLMVKTNIINYLKQREKEKLKEEFYREALRTKYVPKYEYSVLSPEHMHFTPGKQNLK